GKKESEMANFFEDAGEVGSVTVTTQIAGRGVDIRLSDEARAGGGLLLLGLTHSVDRRHDRQFLGRAGRQGDPFKAQFICSFDDPFFLRTSGTFMRDLVKKIGGGQEEEIKHPWLTKAVRIVQ